MEQPSSWAVWEEATEIYPLVQSGGWGACHQEATLQCGVACTRPLTVHLIAIRDKEDPWNSIGSGAITGGILAARDGPRTAFFGFMTGGIILAIIEGVGIAINRMVSASHAANT